MSDGMRKVDENAKLGKVTSAEGKATQYADYMSSGAMLDKWKDRVSKRRGPAPGWKTIEYDAHGNVVGQKAGFDKRASLDVRVATSHGAALRENYERKQKARAAERPIFLDD